MLVCYQQSGHVRAGLTDAYCGPKIVHENANQLVAIEDRAFDHLVCLQADARLPVLFLNVLANRKR